MGSTDRGPTGPKRSEIFKLFVCPGPVLDLLILNGPGPGFERPKLGPWSGFGPWIPD